MSNLQNRRQCASNLKRCPEILMCDNNKAEVALLLCCTVQNRNRNRNTPCSMLLSFFLGLGTRTGFPCLFRFDYPVLLKMYRKRVALTQNQKGRGGKSLLKRRLVRLKEYVAHRNTGRMSTERGGILPSLCPIHKLLPVLWLGSALD